uniref:E3 ubiquitin-protein ligase RFWD3 n=1 Tax=Anthurium amnicola TaxID=1678845 RepID=A0A1D1XRC5_9ARAE
MGLGETDPASEKGLGGKGLLASPAPVPCSICLEAVKDGGDRSTAKLQCGHQFHLDCIGSAFNAKGMMQCPNCRKIEKGNWLYANGCRSFPEISMDDWTHDEDLYDLNYLEMPYGVHWCPFSRLIPSSFEEGESTSIPYHDLVGRHAVFAEHPPAPSSAHSCPYVAYYHPLRPSPSSSQPSTDSLIDGPTFHHQWSSMAGPADIHSHSFPSIDIHYHSWEPHSPPYSNPNSRISGTEQASVPSATMRSTMLDSDGHLRPGSFLHPFVIGHGSPSRAGASAVSVGPPYHGSRGQARVQELHGAYQHHNTTGSQSPIVSGIRRSGGMRSLAPTPTVSDHARFYLFPPAASSGRGPQEAETTGGNRFYAWERDQFAPFPLMQVERDSSWWSPFPTAAGSSDSGSRAAMWHRHGSERSSSDGSSHRPIQPPRMHPFI